MPSRLFTAIILLFWLTMTGWLIQREVVPMMLAEVSSNYQIDLTEEIGSPQVNWTIWSITRKDDQVTREHIGDGDSKIIANKDRTFEFHSNLRFIKDKKFLVGPLPVRRIENNYRVTEDGKLLSFFAKVTLNLGAEHNMSVGIKGDVVNDTMEPCIFLDQFEQKLEKINLPQQGSIVNPMHPVNRLRGLRKGQTWKISLVDPLRSVQNPLVGNLAKQGLTIPSLLAEVKTDTLFWNARNVDCYKIEYAEPGKEVTARTWVRRSDGLVLQQEASHFGFEIVSERRPD